MILARLVVTPDSRRNSISDEGKNKFHITVKEPAKGGLATAKARELVARHFGVPIKNVLVTRGTRSRVKIIEVYD